jgi:diguanylate cyclase (GGDEF)-like protein
MVGLMMIAVVGCFLVITAISLYSLKTTMDRNTAGMTKLIASQLYDAIDGMLKGAAVTSQTMASDVFLKKQLQQEPYVSANNMQERMADYLALMQDNLGYDTITVVSDSSHRYFTPEGIFKELQPSTGHDIWYYQFVQDHKAVDLDVDVDELHEGRWTIFADARIEDGNGHLLGVCSVGRSLDAIRPILHGFEDKYGIKASLVDANGIVQVDADMAHVGSLAPSYALPASDAVDRYKFQWLDDGSYVITRYVDDFGWYLVVSSNDRSSQQAVYGLLWRNIIVTAILLAVLLICIGFITYSENKKMRHLVMRDELTGLPDRRFFLYGYDGAGFAALAIFDIDRFKQVNDVQGHIAGDEILRYIAAKVQDMMPKRDAAIRWGGDEFIILFQEDLVLARKLCEELHRRIQADGKVTISLGLCRMQGDITSSVAVADNLLYKAKAKGRNQLVVDDGLENG